MSNNNHLLSHKHRKTKSMTNRLPIHKSNPCSVHSALLSVMLLCCVTWLIAGCNIVTPVLFIVEGPDQVQPVYTLPEATVVVFLDDRGTVIPRTRLRRALASRVTNELLTVQQIIPGAIDPEAATRLAQTKDDTDALLPIDEIGRRVGAEIIICIVPERFNLRTSAMPHPTGQYWVKIIDAKTGLRLWPGEENPLGYLVDVKMSQKPDSYYQGENFNKLQESLADYSGLRIAQLFFEHPRNPLDAELSP